MLRDKSPKFGFDWDGTLVDCRNRQTAVLDAIWKELGIGEPLDLDSCWNLKREGLSTFQALLRLGVAEKTASSVATRWKLEIEQPKWLAHDTTLPEGLAGVEKAASSGYSIVVVTARTNQSNVRQQIAGSPFANIIDEIFVVDPTEVGKQKAEVLGAQNMKAFVGDSESDFQAARKAGVFFCGVTSGQRSRKFLEAHGVGPLFENTLDATNHALEHFAKIAARP
jgi:phosphoglycolate phosphatase-like HAD superfamily hydrolase